MKFVRKVYNMNPKAGRYPAITFPPELSAKLTNFVVLEVVPDGILIRPAEIKAI